MKSRKLNKDRQHNGQMKIDKRTNDGLQNNTRKTKDRTTRTNGQKEKDKQWSTKHYTEN